MSDLFTGVTLATCEELRTDEIPVFNDVTNEYEGNVEITAKCGNTLFTPEERMLGVCVACQKKLGLLA